MHACNLLSLSILVLDLLAESPFRIDYLVSVGTRPGSGVTGKACSRLKLVTNHLSICFGLQFRHILILLSGPRRTRSRRRTHELLAKERWNCPFGCGTFYRNTSTLSIKKHKMGCHQNPDGGDTRVFLVSTLDQNLSMRCYHIHSEERVGL